MFNNSTKNFSLRADKITGVFTKTVSDLKDLNSEIEVAKTKTASERSILEGKLAELALKDEECDAVLEHNKGVISRINQLII